eukprot:TRINITY_DN1199_c0_g1_i2.p1 TRINITY_DN1199_c0_g1~~TRINITY_DN1199_c0_g1_i2.p1  ORF type:complete len:892 (-),score=316.72 TRINITY_DN1199_c0_g1_i2:59-2734(-)
METPQLIRNVAVIGHLHHGKTSFIDMLVQQTHEKNWHMSKNKLYTATRYDEQEMGLSLKSTPISLLLPNRYGKNFLLNLMDTPGHPNFSDEVSVAIRMADGVVIVIDAVEGPLMQTEKAIQMASQEGLPMILVVNKMDRLILELKMPPEDAYFKLRHMIEQVNTIVKAHIIEPARAEAQRFSPERGNVLFAAPEMGWCFTLQSFAELYVQHHGFDVEKRKGLPISAEHRKESNFNANEFAKRLWGDVYFHSTTRTFKRVPPPHQLGQQPAPRSFVQFVLDPLYKLYSHLVGEERDTLEPMLAELGINIKPTEYRNDVKPLMKLALSQLFGVASAFVDAVTDSIPSPIDAASSKISRTYTGPLFSDDVDMLDDTQKKQGLSRPISESLKSCDASGPLCVQVVKLISKPDATGFDAMARVLSGRITEGDRVTVLGEAYSEADQEAMAVETVKKLWILQARYRIGISSVCAGNWVLIEGIDSSITKTATIVGENPREQPYIFKPLKFNTLSVVKVAVEPLKPSELPKMLDGLRKINSSYPLAITKKEESGEHIIMGTGELYLDCIMRDLRTMYTDIEIKVSEPVVSFCETVSETSSMKCFAHTPNKLNKLTMIAEPLEQGLAEDIEKGIVSSEWEQKKISDFFQTKYNYDLLASRSVWAFGPTTQGPNVLVDDSLPSEVDKRSLSSIKRFVVQGFQWGTREGPLCEEPIRNVKFKLLHATIAKDEVARSSSQLIPTARRVCYSSFLMAQPRLMEPISYIEAYLPDDCIPALDKLLRGGTGNGTRRGQLMTKHHIAGTPMTLCRCFMPAIDSFGFETELRTFTLGQAFCLSAFSHWDIVPGDPLDSSIVLQPLVVTARDELAREFMIKTRRRKGLSEEVTLRKFFDDDLLQQAVN